MCIAVFAVSNAQAKLLIITHSFNRPDFIEIQTRTFQKFLKDDYEFVVFNDAPSKGMAKKIQQQCEKLGLRMVRIPQHIHNQPYLHRDKGESYQHSACRCANVVQYSLDVLGFDHEDFVMIIDSDMFLIKDFSVAKYMEDSALSGVLQARGHIHYIWNGLVFFNMPLLADRRSINFNCGKIEGQTCDVGGYTHYYFQTHPDVRFLAIDGTYVGEEFTLPPNQQENENLRYLIDLKPNNVEFFLDYSFFHYRSGGNWDRKSNDYHSKKTSKLNAFITKLLQ